MEIFSVFFGNYKQILAEILSLGNILAEEGKIAELGQKILAQLGFFAIFCLI